MNKTMNFLKSSVLTIAALTFASPVFADVPYRFNRHIGYVYVHEGEIYKNDRGGVTAIMYVNLPTCDDFSNLRGYIGFSYTAEDGGYFNNYKFYVSGREGHTGVQAFVNVPYNMSESGTLSLSDNTYCEYF